MELPRVVDSIPSLGALVSDACTHAAPHVHLSCVLATAVQRPNLTVIISASPAPARSGRARLA